MDTFSEEKVDEEAEAEADVRVDRHWPFFEEMIEHGALPESDEGSSDAGVVERGGIHDEAKCKA